MRQAAQARLLGPLLLLAASNAFGLGLGRVSTLSTLGSPLELSVGISADLSDGLTPECVNAEVFVGDNRLPSELVRMRLNRAADGTPISLRLVTGTRIDEPVATVSLMLGCPTSVTRRYVVFIDPPSLQLAQSDADASGGPSSEVAEAPPAAVQRSPAPRRRPPAAPSPVFEPGSRTAGPGRPDAGAAADGESRQATAAPRRRRADPPPPPAVAPDEADAGSRLQLESATARAGSPARAAQSASAAAASASAINDLAAQVAATSAALDQERLRELEQRFARLRSDNEATKRSLAELEAGLRAAQGDRYDKWVVYGLAAAVALLLLALLFMMQRLLTQRRLAAWAHSDGDSQPMPSDGASPPLTSTAAAASAAAMLDGGIRAADPAVEHTDAPWPPVEDAEVQAVEDESPDAAEDERQALDQPQTMPGPAYGVAVSRHGVSIDELIDLEQQAEFFTVLGQDEAAIELLTGHVQSTGDASPLPYLKLLEIYRRRGEQSAYTRTRERFNRRFGATVPDWEDEPRPGHSIEDHPAVLERLQTVWPDPHQSMDLLESLLFRRDPSVPEFDLPVYSELLLLYSVARDLAERVVHEEVDLLLPLDEVPAPAAAPASLGFDLLLDSAEVVPEKDRRRPVEPLPEFHLDLLDKPIVPPSIMASNEPSVDQQPPAGTDQPGRSH